MNKGGVDRICECQVVPEAEQEVLPPVQPLDARIRARDEVGLMKGDILERIGNRNVNEYDQFQLYELLTRAGKEINVSVRRNGQR